MKRDEAKALVGTRVAAWTPSWGQYVGTLVGVTEARPWRAEVRVEMLTAWPTPTDIKRRGTPRKPFMEGFLLQVGGVNIEPYEGPTTTWTESVLATGEKELRKLRERMEGPRPSGWNAEWARHVEAVLAAVRAGTYCRCPHHDARDPDDYARARSRTLGRPCCPDSPARQDHPGAEPIIP